MRPRASRVGDKWETSVDSCGPEHPEWETSVGDKCWRQVEDKCKLMRPRPPRLGDKCGRQVEDKCKLMRPRALRVGDKRETSVNSCGPEHPEWETSVGDKCGRQVWETCVGHKCEASVGNKWETSVNLCGPEHPEWETSVGDKSSQASIYSGDLRGSACGFLLREYVFMVRGPISRDVLERFFNGTDFDLHQLAVDLATATKDVPSDMPRGLRQFLDDVHKPTSFKMDAEETIRVTTERGTRPGSPLADLGFNLLMSRLLHLIGADLHALPAYTFAAPGTYQLIN
eukprot:s750_g24.t1